MPSDDPEKAKDEFITRLTALCYEFGVSISGWDDGLTISGPGWSIDGGEGVGPEGRAKSDVKFRAILKAQLLERADAIGRGSVDAAREAIRETIERTLAPRYAPAGSVSAEQFDAIVRKAYADAAEALGGDRLADVAALNATCPDGHPHDIVVDPVGVPAEDVAAECRRCGLSVRLKVWT